MRKLKLFSLIVCALFATQMWADDLCSASLDGISTNANTTGIAQTSCTMKWSGLEGGTSSSIVEVSGKKYYKFGSSGYVQLVLTSGSFQAGDELTVKLSSNGSNKSVSYHLKSTSGHCPSDISVSSTEAKDLTYTLVADDIEDDGSIKIFRGGDANTNARYGSFSVARAAADPVCPSGATISGTQAYYEGQTISLTAELSEGNGEISYQWYKGSIAVGNEVGTGKIFTIANCELEDAGNYYFVASKEDCAQTAESGAYAITVSASSNCAELYPATSGESPTAANQEITLQTEDPNESFGGKIYTHSAKSGDFAASFTYTANGIQLNKGGDDKMRVELTHLMQVGTTITVTLVNPDASKARGFKLCNASGTAKATWQETTTDPYQKTYTVVAGDGLAGSNIFILQRAESSALKELKVSNCGAELFDLDYAITPANDPAYATVTLSATKVASGATATATYSIVDPTAHDFDGWEITSGDATITDATANPAVITMGSENATITLKLKAAAVKYYVHFDSKGGSAVADQLVVKGDHAAVPTAPTKFKYTFGGWSETDGGSTPANLDEIAINDEKTFYAIWTDKVCPTSGEIFSIVYDPDKKPSSETAVPGNSRINMTTYANVTNGIAYLGNTGGSANAKITTSKFKLGGSQAYAKAELECALQEGDTIRLDNSTKIKLSLDSAKTTAITASMASGTHYWVVPKEGDDYSTIFVWQDGSNVEFSYVKVIRPNGSATALVNTADVTKAVKFFEKGQLYIRRGDKVYTITGELVK